MPGTESKKELAPTFKIDRLTDKVNNIDHLSDLFFGVVIESVGQVAGFQ